MKRILTFILILTLLFSGTGCRKTVTQSWQEPAKIEITFSNQSCYKTQIDPDGTVSWKTGDVVHVYHNIDGYLGSLSLTDAAEGTFAGNIYSWTNEGILRFYYLGKNIPDIIQGLEVKPLKIDYSNQVLNTGSDLDNIADYYQVAVYSTYVSEIVYQFYGTLDNVMAIGYFDLSSFTDNSNIKIYSSQNFYNLLTISPVGELSYNVAGICSDPSYDRQSGHILVEKNAGLKYVALLPKSQTESTEVKLHFTNNEQVGEDLETRTIRAGGYIHGGLSEKATPSPISVSVSNTPNTTYVNLPDPTDSRFKKFTVYNTNGEVKKVVIAPGNLVYDQGRFKIHSEQYTTLPDEIYEDPGHVDATYDRFGWATSGWSNVNLIYQPYSRSNKQSGDYVSSNGWGYGPKNNKDYQQSIHPDKNGTSPYRYSDWGQYQFGMDVLAQTPDGRYWRSLGDNEWAYLIGRRDASNRSLFGYTFVGDVKGTLLLPDDWDDSSFISLGLTFRYGCTTFTGQNVNRLTVEQWKALEQDGAVFLPFGGFSDGNTIVNKDEGYYWGAKHKNTDASCCHFSSTQHAIRTLARYKGCYMRMVYQTDGPVW